MEKSLSNYRVYTSNLTPIENLPFVKMQELHIVLAFARDYDGSANTQGRFRAFFDKTTLTHQTIKEIKRKAINHNKVKFFLSIGGRKQDFPFALDRDEVTTWAKNAVTSLKEIVVGLGLDGIDVYYENINPNAESLFTSAISRVISTLKDDGTISMASITVSARLKEAYYDLLKDQNEKLIDYVVYQTHTETSRISDSEDLVKILNGLPYPKNKTFAGHSDARADWATVPPPIFLGAIPQILDQGFFGLSQWMVTAADPNPEN